LVLFLGCLPGAIKTVSREPNDFFSYIFHLRDCLNVSILGDLYFSFLVRTAVFPFNSCVGCFSALRSYSHFSPSLALPPRPPCDDSFLPLSHPDSFSSCGLGLLRRKSLFFSAFRPVSFPASARTAVSTRPPPPR